MSNLLHDEHLIAGAGAEAALTPRIVESTFRSGGGPTVASNGWHQPTTASGVAAVAGPQGQAMRLTTSSLRYTARAPIELARPWSLSLWFRPEEGDWGACRNGFPDLGWALVRPVLFSCSEWALRLCQRRLELQVGEWRVAGYLRLALGRWFHTAVVWDGQDFALYVNGRRELITQPAQVDPVSGDCRRLQPVTASPRPPSRLRGPLDAFSVGQMHGGTDFADAFVGSVAMPFLAQRPLTADDVMRDYLRSRAQADGLELRCSSLAVPARGRARRPDKVSESATAYRERLDWWQNAKYGLFLHWSPAAIENLEIGWARGAGDSLMQAFYDRLATRFNPVAFDPAAWAETMHAAGLKFATMTAKHHDGFCNWPTATNTHNVGHTPYGADILGAFVAALRAAGLRVGIYYSPRDFWWRAGRPELTGPPETRQDVGAYALAQIAELLDYAPDELWFDLGVGTETDAQTWRLIAARRPEAVVNDRNCTPPKSHDLGDFVTCEGALPPRPLLNPDGSDMYWQLATVSEEFGRSGWSYQAGAPLRSYSEQLVELVETVAKGGVLLRGFGPDATGRLPAGNVWRLEEIGDWLRRNGASIYGTHRTRLGRQSWGLTTADAQHVYLHVLNWPGAVLTVYDFHDAAESVHLLDGGTVLAFCQTDDLLQVRLPPAAPDLVDTVVVVRCRQQTCSRVQSPK